MAIERVHGLGEVYSRCKMTILPHINQYANLNAVFFKLSEQEYSFLSKVSDDIFLNGVSSLTCYSNHLASHITHQYELNDEVTGFIEKLLSPVVEEYVKRYASEIYLSIDNLTLFNKYNSCWINFQKKHEFHPLHHHHGIFSFVIWIKIPYTISNQSNQKCETAPEGDFHFILKDDNGLSPIPLNADVSWEGRGVLFNSNLPHIVYPFYTSDDVRVTISGNFKVK